MAVATPCFAHLFGQKRLAQYIIDLVGAGVVQILPFQVDFGTAKILCHLFCVIQTAGAARILVKKLRELTVKFGIIFIMFISDLKLDHGIHKRLGNVLTAMGAEASF